MTSNPRLESLETRRHVLARVRRILVEQLHVDRDPSDIDPDTPLFGTGLGLDSVDAVELVVAVQSAFGVRFDDAMGSFDFFRTVNSVVDVVVERTRVTR